MSFESKDTLLLVNEAIAKGFRVVSTDDNTGWLLSVPARPRCPAYELGEYKTPQRAWADACLICQGWSA